MFAPGLAEDGVIRRLSVDRIMAIVPFSPRLHLSFAPSECRHRPHHHHSRSVHDVEISLIIHPPGDFRGICLPPERLGHHHSQRPGSALSHRTFGVMYLATTAWTISRSWHSPFPRLRRGRCIVVIENISRHIENGMKPYEAAMKGASEIGFTVISMSTSLVAVFIPIFLMGGVVGRLFREFALFSSVAIGVSLFISLTTTP